MDGNTVKMIRKSKCISQKKISQLAHINQSTYSKFENDQIEVRSSILKNILDALNVSFQEFEFIKNNYKYSEKQSILNSFFKTSYNNKKLLKEIEARCSAYLQVNNCELIKDIKCLCMALPKILEDNNFIEARRYAESIWERLSRQDELYVYDLLLLNAILFIFPTKTILEIQKYLSRGFKKYSLYPNIQRYSINTTINISVILMTEKDFNGSLIKIEEAIPICKEQKLFIPLAIAYVRKGICLNELFGSGKLWVEKGFNILDVLEEYEVLEDLKKEYLHFSI